MKENLMGNYSSGIDPSNHENSGHIAVKVRLGPKHKFWFILQQQHIGTTIMTSIDK